MRVGWTEHLRRVTPASVMLDHAGWVSPVVDFPPSDMDVGSIAWPVVTVTLDESLLLVHGFRRLRAWRDRNVSTVPVRVITHITVDPVPVEGVPALWFFMHLWYRLENAHRAFSPFELARLLQKARMGLSPRCWGTLEDPTDPCARWWFELWGIRPGSGPWSTVVALAALPVEWLARLHRRRASPYAGLALRACRTPDFRQRFWQTLVESIQWSHSEWQRLWQWWRDLMDRAGLDSLDALFAHHGWEVGMGRWKKEEWARAFYAARYPKLEAWDRAFRIDVEALTRLGIQVEPPRLWEGSALRLHWTIRSRRDLERGLAALQMHQARLARWLEIIEPWESTEP